MSQTRIVKNPAAWIYIMKTDPTLLKDQNEFDFSHNNSSYDTFKEIISILTSNKLKPGFCLNLNNHNSEDSEPVIQLIVETLISLKFPVNFELNLSSASLKNY